MPEDVGRQISALEKRMDAYVKDQNKVNQKTHDNVIRRIDDLNKVNQRTHDQIVKLEKRMDAYVRDQNKVNQKAYNHISQLEKRFIKLEKKH